MPGEEERHRLALADLEVGHRVQVLAAKGCRRAQLQGVRASHREEGAVLQPPDPGDDGAVVEADDQLHAHRNATGDAFHHPGHVGPLGADGHAVHDADHPLVGVELGLQHQAVAPVAPPDLPNGNGGGEQPSAVLGRSEQGGEAGAGVEPGHAEPVDAPVLPHECCALGIGEEGVILEAEGHR